MALLIFTLALAFGSAVGFYAAAGNLNLDFLCAVEQRAYVRDVPWDCSSYIICMDGQSIPTQCPEGKLYASSTRNAKCEPANQVDASRCHVNMWHYIGAICRANPGDRIQDPKSCGHFFDCSYTNGGADFMDFLAECPYPTLFSRETRMCDDFRFVACGERSEPKAPCEYLQYMQMYNCLGPNCLSCKLHHPSCVGLRNGPQPVPLRNDIIMECNDGRTIDILPIPAPTRATQHSSPTDMTRNRNSRQGSSPTDIPRVGSTLSSPTATTR